MGAAYLYGGHLSSRYSAVSYTDEHEHIASLRSTAKSQLEESSCGEKTVGNPSTKLCQMRQRRNSDMTNPSSTPWRVDGEPGTGVCQRKAPGQTKREHIRRGNNDILHLSRANLLKTPSFKLVVLVLLVESLRDTPDTVAVYLRARPSPLVFLSHHEFDSQTC